jgi:hypothetical protein
MYDGIQYKDAIDKDIPDVLDWTREDDGALYFLIPDVNGKYQRIGDHKYAYVSGKGTTLLRASAKDGADKSFKVKKLKVNKEGVVSPPKKAEKKKDEMEDDKTKWRM